MQSQPPKGKGKVTILAVAVALIVMGGLVAYIYAGTRTTGTTSLSSKISSATGAGNHLTFFNSTISPDGLQLAVVLNTTSLLAGKGLSAQVHLTNTLPRNVSLPVNLTAFPGDPPLEALGRGYQCHGAGLLGMLNLGLYQGRYTAANFSQEAVPLILEAPVAHTCPNPYYYVQSNQSVEFAPNGDRATLSGQKTTGMHMSLATVNCTTGTYTFGPSTVVENGSTTTFSAGTALSWGCGPAYEGVRGYWTLLNGTYITVNDRSNSTILQSLNTAYGLYREFPPGPYTVVAEDYWNQTVFAHFDVRAGPSSSATVAACFVSIPAGSQQGDFANSTFNGDKVTFPNGTSVLFSNYSCPRPIFGGSNQRANLTELAVAAVANSTFLSAENGSEFLFLQPGGLVCSTAGLQKCSITLYFYHYGANSTLFRCGGGLNPNNAQMLYRRDALAGLTVTFYTTSPMTNNEVNSDTSWDLQHPVIQAMSPDQLMITYDNSYPCG